MRASCRLASRAISKLASRSTPSLLSKAVTIPIASSQQFLNPEEHGLVSAKELESVIDAVRKLDPCGEMFGTTDRVKDPLNRVSGDRGSGEGG
jgi:hypothetical protein